MTNWATFYLPHLASVSTVDPLSLIMAGFTALRMKAQVIAAAYYAKVLTLLRAILSQRQAVSMDNQVCDVTVVNSSSSGICSETARTSSGSGRRLY